MAGRVTMAQVAKRAGVSKTAVSFAFNDPTKLSADTAQHVLQVAEEMGYVRDPAARALRSGRTGTLGVLLPQEIDVAMENPYYTQFLRGVGQVCNAERLNLLLVPPVRGSMLKAIPYAAVDGFIVCGLEADRGEVRALKSRGVPFVLVDSERLADVSAVGVDEQSAMRQAASFVIAQGHRDLTVLAFESDGRFGPDGWYGSLGYRWRGVRIAVEDAGLDVASVRVIEVPCTRDGGAQGFALAWADAARRPTAIIAFADVIALGVLGAARGAGVRVPDDLSVIGFDDLPESAWSHPTLTTVHQPVTGKGRLAAEYLVESVRHPAPAAPLQTRNLHADLVVRQSVKRLSLPA